MAEPITDDLSVETAHLSTLAAKQDNAATKEDSATAAATNIGSALWVSHGVVCGASNTAVSEAEEARRAAGEAMQKTSASLSERLRTARSLYESTDENSAESIAKQAVPE